MFDRFLGAGLKLVGPLPDRDAGESGVAVASAFTAPACRAQIGRRFRVQPNLRYIVNPAADPTVPDALVIGLRLELAARIGEWTGKPGPRPMHANRRRDARFGCAGGTITLPCRNRRKGVGHGAVGAMTLALEVEADMLNGPERSYWSGDYMKSWRLQKALPILQSQERMRSALDMVRCRARARLLAKG